MVNTCLGGSFQPYTPSPEKYTFMDPSNSAYHSVESGYRSAIIMFLALAELAELDGVRIAASSAPSPKTRLELPNKVWVCDKSPSS